MQLWARLNVEADSDSSAEDDAFRKDRTWLGPEDDTLSSYVLQPNGLALPTAAFPASMSCVVTAE